MSIALIVIGLGVIAGTLPLEQGIRAVVGWVEGLGPVGPLVYAGISPLITMSMILAAPFSIAAGALFGLLRGTAAVTVYITKLARRAIAEQTDVESAEDHHEQERIMTGKQPADNRTPWIGATVSAVAALLVLSGAALAVFQPEFLTRCLARPR
ncbi:MAG: hypothetical protein EA424_11315 [Planctomycetaceae bacterium]|nr:MAG: hypothetical protein EA424_11315 [Planctomycetaceae bacterium]